MKPAHLRTLAASAVLAAGMAAAFMATGATDAPVNPLRVSMYALPDAQGRFDGLVEVTVTNAGSRTVRIPKWQLPAAAEGSELFQVRRDGQPVHYTGYLVKRPVPGPADFEVIRPGQQVRAVVDLAATYAMAEAGEYAVDYVVPMQYASLSGGTRLATKWNAPMLLQSAPMRLLKVGTPADPRIQALLGTGGTGYRNARDVLGNPGRGGSSDGRCIPGVRPCPEQPVQATYVACTTTRQDQIRQAIADARVYSENAKGYLNAGTVGDRYTWWFGAFLTGRYDSAKLNFSKIDTAMDINNGDITVHCDCDPRYASAYAYVDPTNHYKIYVCNAFWAAPPTGTDSRAGTLIHEMSHFVVVADTNDWVYGQSGAHSLATSNPNRTSGNRAVLPIVVGNADSHEYFAENTPTRN